MNSEMIFTNDDKVFSDDDLRKLKDCVGNRHFHPHGECLSDVPNERDEKFSALINRLECAEKSAKWFNYLSHYDYESEPFKDYKAWLKSAGKK